MQYNQYNFECDYAEGALPEVMNALLATNLEQTSGYGEDAHCENARRLILDRIGVDACVEFLVGGTQVNAAVISAALRPHEAAVCAQSGHINTHETGAVESAGHKVISVGGSVGKITPSDISRALDEHMPVHMPLPRLVYISQSTEWGTIYTLPELRALYAFCQSHGLYLFIDGARLGSALACRAADMTLADVAQNCDVFTIGGTKNGALFGEAAVIRAPEIARDFRYIMKQRGALLAKGRLLGVQFEQLFTGDLYLRAARHACDSAQRIADAFSSRGIELRYPSPTNQIFPVLDEAQFAALSRAARFLTMEPLDNGRRLVRLVTSWATPPEAVDTVVAAISAL